MRRPKLMTDKCLTIFLDDTNKGSEICVMFRHELCDPTNHGVELTNFFAGISSTKENGRMPGLAASAIAFFQTKITPVSILPGGTRNIKEEYIYYVYAKGVNKPVRIRFESAITGGIIYDSDSEELYNMIVDVHELPALETHKKQKQLAEK